MELMLKKLHVGGFDYSVKFPYVFEPGSNLLGLHIYSSLEIRIANTYENEILKWQKVHEVLIHEVVHAVDSVFLDGKMEEDVISKLSVGIYQVLRDNCLELSTSNPIPKKVKIGGFDYDIIYPHKFVDASHYTYCHISPCSFSIKINGEDADGPLSFQFIKGRFMESLYMAICDVYLSGNKHPDYMINSTNAFGNGLYQVIVDNGLEKLIKNGVKKVIGGVKKVGTANSRRKRKLRKSRSEKT